MKAKEIRNDGKELAREIGESELDIQLEAGAITKIGHASVTSYFFGRPAKLTDHAAGIEYDIKYGFGGERIITKRRVWGTMGTLGDVNRRRRNRGYY